jgi:hypothetical protein
LALLFCDPRDRTMQILSMDHTHISSFPNIFLIYSALFEENLWEPANLKTIAEHLETLLLSAEFSKLSISHSTACKLKTTLGKLLNQEHQIYCLLFLYLCCFVAEF